MLSVLGILLLVAGAILTFAVDRQAEGVDLQAVGWILLGGGGLALLAATIRAVGVASTPTGTATGRTDTAPADTGPADTARSTTVHTDEGRLTIEGRRVA